MSVYPTPDFRVYIRDCNTIKEKITKIEEIIALLMDSMVEAAGNQDVTEYRLDDGQTKVQTIYRSADQIRKTIYNLEALKEMYINRCTGRITRLVDHEQTRKMRY